MKKTIAILLILVIGMVGVFADDPVSGVDTTVIKLTTTVDEYTRMAITNSETASFDDLIEATSVYSDDAYDFSAATIHFHAETNRRVGATITMQAQPLTSTENDIETYLDYKITIGDAESYTSGGEADDAVTVVVLKYDHINRKPVSYSKPVSIVITDTLANAAAGTYEGQIAFWVVAD